MTRSRPAQTGNSRAGPPAVVAPGSGTEQAQPRRHGSPFTCVTRSQSQSHPHPQPPSLIHGHVSTGSRRSHSPFIPTAARMFLSRRAKKEPAKMTPNPVSSPTVIPPRTSSSGAHHGVQFGHSPSRSGPGLSTVPEGDWLSQHRHSRKPSIASTSFLVAMQPAATPDPSRYAHEDLNFTTKRSWSAEKEKVICGPFDYLSTVPGKDFRTQLINAFNTWLEVPKESLDVITKVVGMLHTASLLVDDVEDSSSLRRGLPVAHNIFGVAQTINSANYIYFCALQELQRLRNQKAVSIYAEELLHLHRGQGMDLFWRDSLTCPTEEDYLEMVGNKTGGLFRLAIKLMQAESRSLIDCVALVNIVGLIYQIRDDYLNLSSPEYSQNKGLCEDLTEGKFSFPIIHSIRADPTNLTLTNILGQKTTDADVKRYAVSYMEKTGSFEYTRKVLAVLIERARKMADEIDEDRGKAKGIQKILDKMVI